MKLFFKCNDLEIEKDIPRYSKPTMITIGYTSTGVSYISEKHLGGSASEKSCNKISDYVIDATFEGMILFNFLSAPNTTIPIYVPDIRKTFDLEGKSFSIANAQKNDKEDTAIFNFVAREATEATEEG